MFLVVIPHHQNNQHNIRITLIKKVYRQLDMICLPFCQVWQQFHDLVALSSQDEGAVKITYREWLCEALPFGRTFVKCWGKEEVTTYIHIFVYHVGFYLQRWGSIEKFANYAIEGMVAVNKRNLHRATSQFGGYGSSYSGLAEQQLMLAFRRDWRIANNLLALSRPHHEKVPTWAEKHLDLCEEYKQKYGAQRKEKEVEKEKETEKEKEAEEKIEEDYENHGRESWSSLTRTQRRPRQQINKNAIASFYMVGGSLPQGFSPLSLSYNSTARRYSYIL